MIRLLPKLAPLVLVLAVAGCAGGWRNGAPTPGTTTAALSARASQTVAAPQPVASQPISDGVVFKYAGAGNTVHLAGEFNAWSTSADPLTKGADGTWTITRKLAAGRYPYKFVIDGGTWKDDPSAKESVDDGFGGKNSIVVVGGASGGAAPAVASAASPAAPVAARAVTGKPSPPAVTADGVRFTFAGAARSVSLCGSFNDWAPVADPMTQQTDGTWTITKQLKAGSHTYKFLIDGSQWKSDEANAASADDGFGGKNSLLVVK